METVHDMFEGYSVCGGDSFAVFQPHTHARPGSTKEFASRVTGLRVQGLPELELELILSHMTQKPMLRGEVGARGLCACVLLPSFFQGENSTPYKNHGADLWFIRAIKRRAVAQHAAEVAERRAVFDANNSN